jgi:acyl-CoA synthetase (AMP-forming)/AMP-acid ligase II
MTHAHRPDDGTRPGPADGTGGDGIRRGADGVARYLGLPSSLTAALRMVVDRQPDGEALAEIDGGRVSYRELWDRSARVAAGLRAAGARRGDRVVLRLPNGIDWCVAFYGIQLAGCVAVPAAPRLTGPELAHIVRDSAAAVVIEPGQLPSARATFAAADLKPDDIAAIFYTSGTTGRPKGVVTSQANFLANAESARRVLRIGAIQPWRSLVCVPLCHVTGCNSQFLPACHAGGTTVIMPRFEPQRFLRALREERITALMAVPSVFRMVTPLTAGRDTSAVRSVTYGGAPVHPGLVTAARSAFPRARLGTGYGLTETASFCTYLPDEFAESRSGTVGPAVPVVDLRLHEPGPGGVGELLARGPNVTPGYWAHEDPPDRGAFIDGWLRTGDLARIAPDGFVQIVDRIKDVIFRGGESVYSAEVERVLAAHPDVMDVTVLGMPDAIAGEKVAAAVVVPGDREVDMRAVLRFAREQLARHKMPELLAVRTRPLPRNPGGKVMKPQVRAESAWTIAPR